MHLRRVGLVGQIVGHTGNAVTHIIRGSVDVAVDTEFQRYAGAPVLAGGFNEIDALDAGNPVFDHLRHARFDDIRRRAGIADTDGNDGWVDVRVFTQRQAREGHDSECDQQK